MYKKNCLTFSPQFLDVAFLRHVRTGTGTAPRLRKVFVSRVFLAFIVKLITPVSNTKYRAEYGRLTDISSSDSGLWRNI